MVSYTLKPFTTIFKDRRKEVYKLFDSIDCEPNSKLSSLLNKIATYTSDAIYFIYIYNVRDSFDELISKLTNNRKRLHSLFDSVDAIIEENKLSSTDLEAYNKMKELCLEVVSEDTVRKLTARLNILN